MRETADWGEYGALLAHLGSSQVGLFGGVRFGGISFILDAETEHERDPVAMADDYQQKYVAMVAGAIGAVVLLLGLVGIIVNLS